MNRFDIDFYYYPFENPSNLYVENFKDALSIGLGGVVRPFGLRSLFELIGTKRRVYVVNWLDYLVKKEGSFNQVSLVGIAKLLIYVFILALHRNNVIVVIHDRKIHNSQGSQRAFGRWFLNLFQKLFRHSICHSPCEGLHYVPHPLYTESVTTECPSSFGLIFIGSIQRYKKIDCYIEQICKSGSCLNIYGRCPDVHYLTLLETLGESSLRIDGRFLTDKEMDNILRAGGIFFVPHDDESAIVSGSLILGLSYNLPLLVRKTSYSEYLATKIDGIYCFDDEESFGPTLEKARQAAPLINYSERANAIAKEFGDTAVNAALSAKIKQVLGESGV